jgi:2-polyprenyl-3-methyl-5-hydroxy-6-metoxy-1,4-benzoquinol methylase
MAQEWFDTWFDSEYYHLLYKDRNDAEAELFIKNICKFLDLKKQACVLDLACGKGRHSMMLHQLGYNVIGADLSENSIAHAKQFENENLQFYVHDMRAIIRSNYFDVAMNCFTSFGYFKHRHHNQLVANAMVAAVKNGGNIVIDFINSYKGEASIKLQSTFSIQEGNIRFEIQKKLEDGFFKKTITVHDSNKPIQQFSESVQAFYLADFVELFSKAGATLITHFGDYHLHPFDNTESARLIMVFKKK